ncbi:MAG: RDD family protein, partial [Pseudonocardia sp.]|nr:RDD family protein [Pseudonocardia sp.]
MPRWIDSWLPGSAAARPADGHPGSRLGLPAEGVSSVAGFGRRLLALTIDWLLGYLIAALFTGPEVASAPFTVLGIWFLLTAVPVAIFGASAGMTVVGIRVASLGGAAVVGVPRALLR